MLEECEYDFGHSTGENRLGGEKRALTLPCIKRVVMFLLKTTCLFRQKSRRLGGQGIEDM